MTLAASCPRCSSPVSGDGAQWRCLDHGAITPLWRPATASYEAMAEHLLQCTSIPTLLPWPLSPGWTITDFGCVGHQDGEAKASTSSEFDRSVFAGEAQGRWLWIVLRPASAALLLNDEWILCDANELGPELIELPFGGNPPPW